MEELQSFADTLRNWFREIINSFHIVKQEYVVDPKTGNVRLKEHRLTSSMIENRNKIIKMIKHNANGYTNWERLGTEYCLCFPGVLKMGIQTDRIKLSTVERTAANRL